MDASIRKYIAELVGTFVLVFFGVGAAVFSPWSDIIVCALAFGLTVVVMSVTIGKISGCHLNPAISIAMFMDKKLDVKDLIGYVVCQIIGAFIAALLIASIY
ncbi:MAG: aquaporin, partial [Candidatus Methanomethylophilus sp.]|nr:aquaporin [Methanomethylophilus sp.]